MQGRFLVFEVGSVPFEDVVTARVVTAPSRLRDGKSVTSEVWPLLVCSDVRCDAKATKDVRDGLHDRSRPIIGFLSTGVAQSSGLEAIIRYPSLESTAPPRNAGSKRRDRSHMTKLIREQVRQRFEKFRKRDIQIQ